MKRVVELKKNIIVISSYTINTNYNAARYYWWSKIW